SSPAPSPAPSSSSRNQLMAAFSQLPMIFEPNVGQSHPSVKFLAHGTVYSLFLTPEGATMALRSKAAAANGSRSELLTMKLAGANRGAAIAASDPLPGKTNYFLGDDPSRWHRNIPQFARVHYKDVYPGIDLVFYGNQGHLEYDFQVAPGANPALAELEFDGAKRLELAEGNLIVRGETGAVRLESPSVYQQINGHQKPVDARFAVRAANRVGF